MISIANADISVRRFAGPFVVLLGAFIASLGSWGFPIGMGSAHTPLLRIGLMLAVGIAGSYLCRRTKLEIMPVGMRHPWRMALLIGGGVAAYCFIVDAVIFRRVLPIGYLDLISTTPLGARLVYFTLRSTSEGILYQLFFGSAFVLALGAFWRTADGRIAPGAYMTGMILAHTLNIWINVIVPAPPLTATMVAYDALRFFAPGVLWGFLYWRHGLCTPLIAHAATHIFLQPALGFAL